MKKLYKIGDLSQKLDITTRTLRYYEEIGLIQSTRKSDSKYRHYDEVAILKINRILLLRRLSFSIKKIQKIFLVEGTNNMMPIFTNKLRELKSELVGQESLIYAVEKLIDAINKNKNKNEISISTLESIYELEKEGTKKTSIQSNDIKGITNNKILGEIRVLRLRPMKVAYYRVISDQPENDAWNVMNPWIKENKLNELFTTRYMGFNNPNPTPDSNTYGYEVWITVTDNVTGNDEIGIKEFEGGLYAVASTNMYDIVQSWQLLYNQINKNEDYVIDERRWIEEHLILDENSWGSNMQVDLYCPIKSIST